MVIGFDPTIRHTYCVRDAQGSILEWNIAKLPVAALSGIGIGNHNLFSKNKAGWGWGDRIPFNQVGNLEEIIDFKENY